MYCFINGGSKLKITDFELKIYRLLSLLGLVLLAVTYLLRWSINEPNAIIALVINSVPNLCEAITLPFLTLLIFNKYKPGFLIKHKAKIFYSTMPVITAFFIVSEAIGLQNSKYSSGPYNMVMSIAGMLVCIIVFEALNKPVILTSYKDITRPHTKAS